MFSRREKVLLVALLLAGGGYLLDQLWLQPLNMRGSQLDVAGTQLRTALEQNKNEVDRYGRAEQQERIIADYAAVRAQVPVQPMITEVIGFIGAVAMETGVTTRSVHYNAEAEAKAVPAVADDQSLQEITFKVEARGSRAGLLEFLGRMENAPRLFNVTRSRIEAMEPGSPTTFPTSADLEPSQTVPAGPALTLDSDDGELGLYKLGLEIKAYYRS